MDSNFQKSSKFDFIGSELSRHVRKVVSLSIPLPWVSILDSVEFQLFQKFALIESTQALNQACKVQTEPQHLWKYYVQVVIISDEQLYRGCLSPLVGISSASENSFHGQSQLSRLLRCTGRLCIDLAICGTTFECYICSNC